MLLNPLPLSLWLGLGTLCGAALPALPGEGPAAAAHPEDLELIREYASHKPSHGEIETEAILDDDTRDTGDTRGGDCPQTTVSGIVDSTERARMPAKDLYHDIVKHALVKDGWTITHDPFPLKWGRKDLFVDLGAEKVLTAEKEGRKIVVEVKSFLGRSEVEDLRNALGQFILYRDILEEKEPDRELFLAVPTRVFVEVFEEPIGAILIEKRRVQLIVFDKETEEIVRWVR